MVGSTGAGGGGDRECLDPVGTSSKMLNPVPDCCEGVVADFFLAAAALLFWFFLADFDLGASGKIVKLCQINSPQHFKSYTHARSHYSEYIHNTRQHYTTQLTCHVDDLKGKDRSDNYAESALKPRRRG